jgi:flagellar protein FlaI
MLSLIKDTLQKTLGYEWEFLTNMDKKEYLRQAVESFVESRGMRVSKLSMKRIEYYIIRDFVGHAVIDVMMKDDEIEDISCDGVGVPIFVSHRKYESIKSNLVFTNEDELNSFVVALAQRGGKQISVSSPILDGTTQEGHRVNATYSREISTRGSTFTIRRFKDRPFTPVDLLKYKTVSPEMMAYLWLGVENGESMILCGGTASGKTSALNSSRIPGRSICPMITGSRQRPGPEWVRKGSTANPLERSTCST